MPKPIDVASEIEFIDAKKTHFRYDDFGDLNVTLPNGSNHSSVTIARAFPLSDRDRYISIADKDQNELAIIEKIKQLSKSDREIVKQELERTYFTPQILQIHSVEGRFGVTQWEVDTDRGPTQINLQSRSDVMTLEAGRVVIRDVDGNRFEIPNYRKLDPKSFTFLETFI